MSNPDIHEFHACLLIISYFYPIHLRRSRLVVLVDDTCYYHPAAAMIFQLVSLEVGSE